MNGWKIYKEDMKDIIWGATFLGAGGGGSPQQAFRIMDNIFDEEKIGYIEVVKPEAVSNNDEVVVSGGMGAPEVSQKSWTREAIFALEKLEEVKGKEIPYILPFEIGAGNFAVPIQTAALKTKSIIDADGAGRAIPELQMVTYNIYGVPIAPFTLADAKGNSAVFYSSNAVMVERLGRAVTSELGGSTGFAGYVMSGAQMKKSVIQHTISKAKNVGERIRKAKKVDRDPVLEVISFLDGFKITEGRITNIETETKGGFDFGKVIIEGQDGIVRVDYKNENMIAWKNEEPIAMVPDLICWISSNGRPLTNADLQKDLDIALIGVMASEELRKPKVYNLFKPILRTLGYNGEYVPLEEMQ